MLLDFYFFTKVSTIMEKLFFCMCAYKTRIIAIFKKNLNIYSSFLSVSIFYAKNGIPVPPAQCCPAVRKKTGVKSVTKVFAATGHKFHFRWHFCVYRQIFLTARCQIRGNEKRLVKHNETGGTTHFKYLQPKTFNKTSWQTFPHFLWEG